MAPGHRATPAKAQRNIWHRLRQVGVPVVQPAVGHVHALEVAVAGRARVLREEGAGLGALLPRGDLRGVPRLEAALGEVLLVDLHGGTHRHPLDRHGDGLESQFGLALLLGSNLIFDHIHHRRPRALEVPGVAHGAGARARGRAGRCVVHVALGVLSQPIEVLALSPRDGALHFILQGSLGGRYLLWLRRDFLRLQLRII
mmetsp:Transcript_71040/g.169526  ORF Transcript_71040/g.169526 Transcript_71040/m.169526 type:complete len:200 (+) Transcript_71040:1007-1606(+)